jgi:hypothetical protein
LEGSISDTAFVPPLNQYFWTEKALLRDSHTTRSLRVLLRLALVEAAIHGCVGGSRCCGAT